VPKTQRPDVGGVGPKLEKRFIQRQPQSSSKAESPKQAADRSLVAGQAVKVAQRGDALALLRSLPNKTHPHAKPAGLIARLIGAVTRPGDLVVDPAAGSFVVMRVANQMGRDFVGRDIADPLPRDFAPLAGGPQQAIDASCRDPWGYASTEGLNHDRKRSVRNDDHG
jgi:DNA methylase